jgi:DNA-binding NtrC family response regulator
MRHVFETIDKVADTDVTVLVRGEGGAGNVGGAAGSRLLRR